jgi:vacuolar-type H+-ATPase catalytic subunit A/Vma1
MSKIQSNGTIVIRDLKSGNGTALLDYQNYANLQKHLKEMKPIIEDQASASYFSAKQSLQEIHDKFNRTTKKELDREN